MEGASLEHDIIYFMAPNPIPLEVRFWQFVDKTSTCWLWTGYKQLSGHGRISIARSVAKEAHRVSYELFVGPIPVDREIHHICGVPACVNPEHLELVTDKEHGQRTVAMRSSCKNGHFYTDENTYYWKDKRYCRECRKEVERRRNGSRFTRA